MGQITTQSIDAFVATRRTERGKKPGSVLASATMNMDLRHVKAALRVAIDWEFLRKMPKIRMLKEPEKLVVYVTPEHFEKIYREACPLAKRPKNPGQNYEPCIWWQALLTTAYMTGWRIGELLALRVEDVDLQTGYVITRHLDNKGKRDERVPIHPVVIEHLERVIGDNNKFVFVWSHDERALWTEFGRIQREAGICIPCLEEHTHTPSCFVYGFHDFRRAFGTANAPGMKAEVLRKMMRHKSYKTTLGYINLANQVDDAAKNLVVPDTLKKDCEPAPSVPPLSVDCDEKPSE
jgi:integrase